MPNLVHLVSSLLISYLFSTFNSRLHIDHSLDYPSKLYNNMQYVFAFITKRYIASRQVFAANLTYLIIVIIAY